MTPAIAAQLRFHIQLDRIKALPIHPPAKWNPPKQATVIHFRPAKKVHRYTPRYVGQLGLTFGAKRTRREA